MPNNQSMLRLLRRDLKKGLVEVGNSQSPFVRSLAARYAKEYLPKRRKDILTASEDLLASRDTWQHMIACAWINGGLPLFPKEDFRLFERWLREYIFSWGTCDDFCKRVLNPLFQRDLGLFPRIRRWTESEGKWVRRASAVAFIRSGGGGYIVNIPTRYVFQIADRLMQDEDIHVQKGLGWMLKAASICHQKEVYDYLMQNRVEMPRTAFRYAIEKLPEHLRREAMAS